MNNRPKISQTHIAAAKLAVSGIFHFGTLLKDLCKKPVVREAEPWSALSKLDINSVENILKYIAEDEISKSLNLKNSYPDK